ncbi:MAG: EscU/YscU/HrcU family type III secretion system export apparatus switch protein [Spirochaetales bacterium]
MAKKAVALQYKPEDTAPTILAKGKGRIAERILLKAREAGIPIVEDGEILPLLFQQNIGEYIPPSCYEAIAEILRFVYSIERKRLGNESTKS